MPEGDDGQLRAAAVTRPARFIRSRHIICYWDGPSVVVYNYATRQRRLGSALLCQILDACDKWSSLAGIIERCEGVDPETVRTLVERLAALRILHRSGQALPESERQTAAFGAWNPAAGFFHASTKDVWYAERVHDEVQGRSAAKRPPRAVTPYPRAPTVRLPFAPAKEQFPAVLLARRTWRRFSADAITHEQLGNLLGLTAGFQQFVLSGPAGRSPQRTSPSGGARHPIEAYVLALNVRGLPRGLYHYASDVHVLQKIRRGIHPGGVQRYLPAQYWFEDAAAIVFLAGIFGRTSFRYDTPRAYRAVLIEAGHLCQTFCLTATWMGLAPFCSMAIADREIEKDLRLDGISESVLYAAGVGCRAASASESFAPEDIATPTIEGNPAFQRSRAPRRSGTR